SDQPGMQKAKLKFGVDCWQYIYYDTLFVYPFFDAAIAPIPPGDTLQVGLW
ncbi:unnamed protein product, partial [marine sediment metagenome]